MDRDTINAGVKWALVKLSAAFPASFLDADTVTEKQRLYVELIEAHEWITSDIWRDSIRWLQWHHEGDYVPPPAKIIEVCREKSRDTRQQEASDAVLALPVSVIDPPERYDPAKWDRNVAIGKARQRRRIALIEAYRATFPPSRWKYGGEQSHVWRGKDEPTEEEIDIVLREMVLTGELKSSLARALAIRVPISALREYAQRTR